MKEVGIIRRIDDLGRIVIPREFRRQLRVREGDPMEISLYEDAHGKHSLKIQPCIPLEGHPILHTAHVSLYDLGVRDVGIFVDRWLIAGNSTVFASREMPAEVEDFAEREHLKPLQIAFNEDSAARIKWACLLSSGGNLSGYIAGTSAEQAQQHEAEIRMAAMMISKTLRQEQEYGWI